MADFVVFVKPTAAAADVKHEVVGLSAGSSVGDVKAAVAPRVGAPAAALRLIFKGHIMKDAQTLESYGETGGWWVRGGGVRQRARARRRTAPLLNATDVPARSRSQAWRAATPCTWWCPGRPRAGRRLAAAPGGPGIGGWGGAGGARAGGGGWCRCGLAR